ncbi:MAG TPA: hypothetical protein DEF51_08360 [Myxococcales bacterium]|nr:hypothetical protein [Myxococcales bacterium]
MWRTCLVLVSVLASSALCGCDGDSSVPSDAGPEGRDTGTACSAGQTSCGGGCVDTERDLGNCGSCGNACALDESCASGVCRAMMACGEGMADCGAGCIDVQGDDANCGICGRSCGADEMCIDGACATAMCGGAETRCGAACVDLRNDDANCGACGVECPAGELCLASACSSACPAPGMVCGSGAGSSCVDVTTDAANCGACDNVCPEGRACVDGGCRCDGRTELCGGACVDTMTDTANCGACGAACPAGQTCESGSCACPGSTELCRGACTLTDIDSLNCGACGNICAGSTPTCVMGTCMASSCTGGEIPCGASCVDPRSDDRNCGGCGVVCGAGTGCVTAACRPLNDRREDAEPITLAAGEVTVSASTVGATKDRPTSGSECFGCVGGGNVWYSVTLPRDGVLYVDTHGSSYDTKLFLTDAAGALVTAGPGEDWCQDDHPCGSAPGWGRGDSRIYGHLTAGTYLISVGGCTTGDFTLSAQYLPETVSSYFYDAPLEGDDVTSSTSLAGRSTTAGTCGGASSGEDARWFVTCGGQPQTFSLCRSDSIGIFVRERPEYERTNGMVNFDPRMYMRSAQTGGEVLCNDDGASMGATDCRGYDSTVGTSALVDGFEFGSRINGVVMPRGIGSVFVDSSSGSAGMDYRLLHRVNDAP